jgi:hypothetical protein
LLLLFTLYSLLFTLYSLLFTLYSLLFTLYSLLFTLYSLLLFWIKLLQEYDAVSFPKIFKTSVSLSAWAHRRMGEKKTF